MDNINNITGLIKFALLIIVLNSLWIIIKIINKLLRKVRQNKKTKSYSKKNYKYPLNNQNTPYRKRSFLTQNELNFYRKLKPLSDKYNLCIMAKIRLADLVEVNSYKTREFNKYFSKIKSKHIDFALASPESLEIKYLIELDDSSHNRKDRVERDLFVNKLCRETGYKLIRTQGNIKTVEDLIINKDKQHMEYFA